MSPRCNNTEITCEIFMDLDPADTYAILLSDFLAWGVSFPVFNLVPCKSQLLTKRMRKYLIHTSPPTHPLIYPLAYTYTLINSLTHSQSLTHSISLTHPPTHPPRPLARNGNFFKNAVIQKKLQLHPKPYSYTFSAVVRLTKHTPLRKTHSHVP